jgi:hypothetical protein
MIFESDVEPPEGPSIRATSSNGAMGSLKSGLMSDRRAGYGHHASTRREDHDRAGICWNRRGATVGRRRVPDD